MPTKQSQKNQLLIDELAKSNQRAFRKLYELYWESMFVKAKIMIGEENVAKDIVQDIWVRLWQQRETLNVKNFSAYLSKAVRNECFKYFRDRKFSPTHLAAIEKLQPIIQPDVTKQHDLEEMHGIILQSLNNLPKRCRQIFELSHTEQYSNEEIANQLGISKRSVENQISLALKSIRAGFDGNSFPVFFLNFTFFAKVKDLPEYLF